MNSKPTSRKVKWVISLVLAIVIAAAGGVVLFGNVLKAHGPGGGPVGPGGGPQAPAEQTVEQPADTGGTSEQTTVDVSLGAQGSAPSVEESPAAPTPPAVEEPAPVVQEQPTQTQEESAAGAGDSSQQGAGAADQSEGQASVDSSGQDEAEGDEAKGGEDALLAAAEPAAPQKDITVTVKPTSVSLAAGETKQLTATKSRSAATLAWSSSNESVATVNASGLVTAKKSGTAVITVTATYSGSSATAETSVTVTSGSYPLFCYALIPGAQADDNSTSADARWMSVGVATVTDVPDPASVSGTVSSYSVNFSATQFNMPMYPDLTLNGTTYRYSASGNEAGTYSLIPMRLVSASGCNAGSNGYFKFGGSYIPTTYSSWSTKCYHLDFTCVLNDVSYHNVTFAVKEPGDETFIPISDMATRVKDGTAESAIKPSDSAVAKTISQSVSTISGTKQLSYTFDGWYTDEACTNKANFSGTITSGTVYYGRYVQTNTLYTARYFYDGTERSNKAIVQGPIELGKDVEVSSLSSLRTRGTVSGYTYSHAVTSSDSSGVTLTPAADWTTNNIDFHFSKSTRSYTVNYYLNGTTTPVAASDQLIGEIGDTVTATPKDITGYTPVSTAYQSLEIKKNGTNVITFYYYRNVTLTAGSANPVTYDGQSHGLSYTIVGELDGMPADYSNISLGSFVDAGTYEVTFPAKTVGKLDKSKTYIVASCVNGSIVINPAPLEVVTPDARKGYDGEPLEAEGSVSGLVADETVSFQTTGSQTEVGTSDNTYTLTWDGTAKQGNYALTEHVGKLEVTEFSGVVTVTTTGGSFTYDGKEHAATVSVEGLPDKGYTVQESASSEVATDVTDKPITATADTLVIVNAEGQDVTDRLNVSYVDATLSISPATLHVTTADGEKVYDGTPLTAEGSIEGFVGDEGASFAVTGSQTEVGSSSNTYSLTFDGSAKQGNYVVDATLGTLRVTEFSGQVTATAKGGSFIYDGEAHGATVEVEGLPEGYVLKSASSSATATDVTATPVVAKVDELVIANASGKDVTSQLNVAYVDGSITVSPAQLSVTTPSASKVYDGEPLTSEGTLEGLVADQTVTFATTGSQTEIGSCVNGYTITWDGTAKQGNYRINESLGTLTVSESTDEIVVTTTGGTFTYDGKPHGATVEVSGLPKGYAVDEAASSAQVTDATSAPVRATADTLVIINAQGKDVTKKLNISYADGEIVVRPASLSISTPDAAKTYDGTALTAEGTMVGLVKGEKAAFATTGTQTEVGSSANTYTLAFAGEEGAGKATAKRSNYTVSATVGTLTVSEYDGEIVATTTGGTFTYDGQPHGATVEVTGLPDGYVLDQAASSATATDVTATDLTATADRLVIRNAAGEDVTARLKVRKVDGTISVQPAELTIVTAGATKTYDGEPLVARGSIAGLVEGETASFAATGSQTAVGSSANTYALAFAGEEGGEGATAKRINYRINETVGTLSVTEYAGEIVATTTGGTFTYDGTVHRARVSVSDLPSGYVLDQAASSAKRKNVNAEPIAATADRLVIRNAAGEDVTARLNVSYVDGSITVLPATLTVVTPSGTKVYDGKALTEAGSVSGLIGEETVDFATTGTQTAVGSSDNTYTLAFAGDEGANATAKRANYAVSATVGTLTVTESADEVVVTTTGGTFTYDGKPHGATVEVSELPEGYTLEQAESSANATDATETAVRATADRLVIRNAEGEDVTARLHVIYHDGAIRITPAPLAISTPTASKTYDGEPLVAQGSITGLVNGETASFATTGTQTAVGSSENTYELAWDGTAKQANYELSVSTGTLTVSESTDEIVVTTTGGTFTYDGKPHGATVELSELPAGYTLEQAASSASATDVTETAVRATADRLVIRNAEGEDVTARLKVTQVPGYLTIDPAVLTIETPNASKTYDGEPLVAPGTISGFVNGETATFVTTGTRTKVGVAPNHYTLTWDGTAQEGNYTISKSVGTLTVAEYAGEVEVGVTGGTFTYDGQPHGATVSVSALPKGYQLVSAASSATVTTVADGEVTATADDLVIQNASGEDVTERLNVVMRNATIAVSPAELRVTTLSDAKTYDGDPLKAGGSISGLVNGETATFAATGSQTEVGATTNSYELTWDGTAESGNYRVVESLGTLTVTESADEIVVTTTGGTFTYDGKPHGACVSVSQLPTGYHVEQAASSATATDVTADPVTATADTLVIRNAQGKDVTEKLSIVLADGTISIEAAPLYVSTPDADKTYDGLALTAAGTMAGLVDGETASFATTGTQTAVGSSANTYELTWDGTAKQTNYRLVERVGTLGVSEYAGTVRASASHESLTYDGRAHGVTVTVSTLPMGYVLEAAASSATATDVTDKSVTAKVDTLVIRNAAGEDVTDRLNIERSKGSISIAPAVLSIRTPTESRVYNGSALTAAGTMSGLVNGETASFATTGTQTAVGSSDNTYELAWDGTAKQANYELSEDLGTLTVTEYEGEIVASVTGGSFTYDGEAHTATVSVTGLPAGYTLEEARSTTSVTNVSEGEREATADTIVIRNAQGEDVTDKLNITRETTTIQVTAQEVTVSVTGHTNVAPIAYDGTEHRVVGYDLSTQSSSYALANVSFQGEAEAVGVDAGTYPMGLNPAQFLNTDDNYQVTFEISDGYLVIDKATDSMLVGTVTLEGWTYGDTELPEPVTQVEGANDYAEPTFTYRAIGTEEYVDERPVDAGSYEVMVTWEATDNCPEITATGSFTISPAVATLDIPSATKVYDGTPLEATGTITLVAGETATVKGTVSVTDVTEEPVVIAYEIDWGDAKASNYEVVGTAGTLSVTPAPVGIVTPSASKVYDGKALTADEGAGVTGLVGDETVAFTVTGSQTDVGSSDNTYEIEWAQSETEDGPTAKQSNYEVTSVEVGTLTVTETEEQVVVTTTGGTFAYDGTEHVASVSVSQLPEGYELREASSSASATNVTKKPVAATADTLVIENAKGVDVTDKLDIVYSDGTIEVVPTTLRVSTPSAHKTYDGTPLEAEGSIDGLVGDETVTFATTGTLTHAGERVNTYDLKWDGTAKKSNYQVVEDLGILTIAPKTVSVHADNITQEFGGAESDLTVTIDGLVNEDDTIEYTIERGEGDAPASYVISVNGEESQGDYLVEYLDGTLTITDNTSALVTLTAPTARKAYDGEPLLASNAIQVDGLPEGFTATAEVSGSQTDAGTSDSTITSFVIRDESGNDVTAYFRNVSTELGVLEIDRRELQLVSESATKEYDGKALTARSVTATGDGFVAGEGATYDVTGTQTTAGSSANRFTYVLRANTKPTNYTISVRFGTLLVTSRTARYEIDVQASSDEVLYDGAAHEVSGFETLEFTVDGNAYTVEGLEAQASLTSAGSVPVVIEGAARVLDAAGNDVTQEFSVNVHDGLLTVRPRSISFASESAEKVYDGKPLTAEGVTVGGDGFAEGEGAEITVTGSQTLVGSSDNTFVYAFSEGTQAKNYDISLPDTYGTLRVFDRTARYGLTVTAKSGEFAYDGSPHTVSGLKSTVFTLDDVTFAVEGLSATATATDAGTYQVSIEGTPLVRDLEGNDVTNQFSVETATGTLRIDPREVTLTSASASKPYDGNVLTDPTVTVGGDGFAAGEGASYQVSGVALLPGSTENSFTYELNEGTKARNYHIATIPGILSITNRDAAYEIELKANSDEVVYDGEEHEVDGFETLEFSIDGNDYVVEGIEAHVAATEAGVYPVEITGDARVMDAAGNDVTDQFAVTVQGGTLTIRATYTLTINYVSSDGEQLAEPFVGRYEPGEAFGPIISPEIEGYVASVGTVSSDRNGMPAQDVEVTVTYTPITPDSPSTPTDTTPDDQAGQVTEAAAVALIAQNATPPDSVLSVSDDGNATLVTLEGERVPLVDGVFVPHWAVLNLLLALATVATSAWLLLSMKRKADEDDAEDKGVTLTDEQVDDIVAERRKHRNWAIWSACVAVISVVAFFLTEDLTAVPQLVDRWTLLMVVLAVVQLVTWHFTRTHRKREKRRLNEAIDEALDSEPVE